MPVSESLSAEVSLEDSRLQAAAGRTVAAFAQIEAAMNRAATTAQTTAPFFSGFTSTNAALVNQLKAAGPALKAGASGNEALGDSASRAVSSLTGMRHSTAQVAFALNDLMSFSAGARAGVIALSNNIPGLLSGLRLAPGVIGGLNLALAAATTAFVLLSSRTKTAKTDIKDLIQVMQSQFELPDLPKFEFDESRALSRIKDLDNAAKGLRTSLTESVDVTQIIAGNPQTIRKQLQDVIPEEAAAKIRESIQGFEDRAASLRTMTEEVKAAAEMNQFLSETFKPAPEKTTRSFERQQEALARWRSGLRASQQHLAAFVDQFDKKDRFKVMEAIKGSEEATRTFQNTIKQPFVEPFLIELAKLRAGGSAADAIMARVLLTIERYKKSLGSAEDMKNLKLRNPFAQGFEKLDFSGGAEISRTFKDAAAAALLLSGGLSKVDIQLRQFQFENQKTELKDMLKAGKIGAEEFRLRMAALTEENKRFATSIEVAGISIDSLSSSIGNAFANLLFFDSGISKAQARLQRFEFKEQQAHLRELFRSGQIGAEEFRLRMAVLKEEMRGFEQSMDAVAMAWKSFGVFAKAVMKRLIADLATAAAKALLIRAITGSFGRGGFVGALLGNLREVQVAQPVVALPSGAVALPSAAGAPVSSANRTRVDVSIGGTVRARGTDLLFPLDQARARVQR